MAKKKKDIPKDSEEQLENKTVLQINNLIAGNVKESTQVMNGSKDYTFEEISKCNNLKEKFDFYFNKYTEHKDKEYSGAIYNILKGDLDKFKLNNHKSVFAKQGHPPLPFYFIFKLNSHKNILSKDIYIGFFPIRRPDDLSEDSNFFAGLFFGSDQKSSNQKNIATDILKQATMSAIIKNQSPLEKKFKKIIGYINKNFNSSQDINMFLFPEFDLNKHPDSEKHNNKYFLNSPFLIPLSYEKMSKIESNFEKIIKDTIDLLHTLLILIYKEIGCDFELLVDVIDTLRDNRQVILTGPPGSGKTYLAQKVVKFSKDIGAHKTVQFHPSFGYEEFIYGIKPDMAMKPTTSKGGRHVNKKNNISFRVTPGILTEFIEEILSPKNKDENKNYIMIIDEINRANLPTIFGELYYLLEYRGESINTQYRPNYSIPKNLFFIGTMNPLDKSTVEIDFALRRRFDFIECKPSKEQLETYLIINELRTDSKLDINLLDDLNGIIANEQGEEIGIGHSFFMKPEYHKGPDSKFLLQRLIKNQIRPLLKEYVSRFGIDFSKVINNIDKDDLLIYGKNKSDNNE
ncbi:McrB family protein [Bacillus sp. OK048]|uniref:McrB family protein n=1 Tax=Bacillus sp. OK048 TaxID=1882761 RepID=UPI00088F92CD|nr:AAA family ATPase [Bacillus sp. OK048]SDN62805.1 AAA domain (dynein-related subfamily) [Bacillus sp. OK048]